MIHLHDPASRPTAVCTCPPLPARLLRRVLVGGRHSIGQRVLIAGDRCGELAEWFQGLGFNVDAIDDSAERLTAIQREGTQFDIRLARFDRWELQADESYDLVLTDELDLHRGSLLGLDARLTTARLLACLKPGGEFVVVHEASRSAQHDSACWTRHLACFPGRLKTVEYPAPWFSRATWEWLVGRGRPRRDLTVSLRTPSERLSVREWCEHARRGLLTGMGTCCSSPAPQQDQLKAA